MNGVGRASQCSEGVSNQKLGRQNALVLLILDLRFVSHESQSTFIDLGFSFQTFRFSFEFRSLVLLVCLVFYIFLFLFTKSEGGVSVFGYRGFKFGFLVYKGFESRFFCPCVSSFYVVVSCIGLCL